LARQAARALLILVGAPEYAAMVDPHWVRFDGMPPVTPALDQSIARLGARILDHPWAWPEADITENSNKESRNGRVLPGGGVIFERTNLELLRVLGKITSENEKFMLVCT
jgi:hypothetical protein